jgi:uncharacterized protein
LSVSIPETLDVTDNVYVAETRYGFGVFARQDFEAEETIDGIEGRVIDDPDYDSEYCVEFGDSLSLEPHAPYRFLNHSCTPNCDIVWTEEWDEEIGAIRRRLFLDSLVPIRKGQQLTIDYAWPASSAIPCECDSNNCRGWIVAETQIDEIFESDDDE